MPIILSSCDITHKFNIEHEIWVPVFDSNFKDVYKVSNLGRVIRIKKYVNGKITENKMKATYVPTGYMQLGFRKDDCKAVYRLHRLIYFSFNPNVDQSLQINHINSIKTDNRLENLEAVSQSENIKHCYNAGNHKGMKIQSSEYPKILDLYNTNNTILNISNQYKVSHNTIRAILKNHFGINSRKNNLFTIEDHKKILDLYKNGYTLDKIAEIFNTSQSVISHSLLTKKSEDQPKKILIEYNEDINIWKPIIIDNINYPYYINQFCIIKNLKNKLMKPMLTLNGYHSVVLRSECGVRLAIFIHRILALLFIPNPTNKPFVNHIDGNKLNNNIDNLEWCTHRENMQHAWDTGLHKEKKITNDIKEQIKELLKTTEMDHKEIGRLFKVDRSVISRIKTKYSIIRN